ncbi:hypothetical protein LXA43DRAFT_1066516 [Ganoderma leucocontextum]|nr:hypothetical protein LXA43DRAFT_1066516 [Ganoderma leucocontextum]
MVEMLSSQRPEIVRDFVEARYNMAFQPVHVDRYLESGQHVLGPGEGYFLPDRGTVNGCWFNSHAGPKGGRGSRKRKELIRGRDEREKAQKSETTRESPDIVSLLAGMAGQMYMTVTIARSPYGTMNPIDAIDWDSPVNVVGPAVPVCPTIPMSPIVYIGPVDAGGPVLPIVPMNPIPPMAFTGPIGPILPVVPVSPTGPICPVIPLTCPIAAPVIVLSLGDTVDPILPTIPVVSVVSVLATIVIVPTCPDPMLSTIVCPCSPAAIRLASLVIALECNILMRVSTMDCTNSQPGPICVDLGRDAVEVKSNTYAVECIIDGDLRRDPGINVYEGGFWACGEVNTFRRYGRRVLASLVGVGEHVCKLGRMLRGSGSKGALITRIIGRVPKVLRSGGVLVIIEVETSMSSNPCNFVLISSDTSQGWSSRPGTMLWVSCTKLSVRAPRSSSYRVARDEILPVVHNRPPRTSMLSSGFVQRKSSRRLKNGYDIIALVGECHWSQARSPGQQSEHYVTRSNVNQRPHRVIRLYVVTVDRFAFQCRSTVKSKSGGYVPEMKSNRLYCVLMHVDHSPHDMEGNWRDRSDFPTAIPLPLQFEHADASFCTISEDEQTSSWYSVTVKGIQTGSLNSSLGLAGAIMVMPHGQGQTHFIGLNDGSYTISADEETRTVSFYSTGTVPTTLQIAAFGSVDSWLRVVDLCATMRASLVYVNGSYGTSGKAHFLIVSGMAPVFSRVCNDTLRLPVEMWLEVARALSPSEKRAMMLTCKTIHNALAPDVYRVLTVHERVRPRPARSRRRLRNVTYSKAAPPAPLLPCLLLTLRHTSGWAVRHRYVDYVKSFTFISYLPVSNLRAIPMLAQVLRYMPSLQFLRIDLCDDSVPLLLGLFHRYSLIRRLTFPTTVASTLTSWPHTILYLPAFGRIRTNQPEVAARMGYLRALEDVVVDGVFLQKGFGRFIRAMSTRSARLSSLSITLAGTVEFVTDAIRTVVLSFCGLEYMSFRSDPQCVYRNMGTLFNVMNEYPQAVPGLRCVGVNQGEMNCRSKDFHCFISKLDMVVKNRYRLVMVILGTSTWSRKDEYSRWVFTEQCFDYPWPRLLQDLSSSPL